MVGGLQSARSVVHLARAFELANEARLLPDPELAAHRLGLVLAAAGIETGIETGTEIGSGTSPAASATAAASARADVGEVVA
jgi:hypothetical protein